MNFRMFALLAMAGALGGAVPEAPRRREPEPEPERVRGDAVIVQGPPSGSGQQIVGHLPRTRVEPRPRIEATQAQRAAVAKRERRAAKRRRDGGGE